MSSHKLYVKHLKYKYETDEEEGEQKEKEICQ